MSLFFALALLMPSAPPADQTPASLRVMSFNIRYANAGDVAAGNGWPGRRETVAQMIAENADIVGTQEVLAGQLDDLTQRLPEFTWEGVGRSDGKRAGEFTPVGYRTDRFTRTDGGTFWLSQTPEIAGSVGWDAQLPRIATWVRLVDRHSGQNLLAVNVHFDHRGTQARLESAKLLRAWIAAHAAGNAVVLTGDFNTLPDSAPYGALTAQTSTDQTGTAAGDDALRDARGQVAAPQGPEATWNGFSQVVPGQRIDFIFLHGPATATAFRTLETHIADTQPARFPSDHLPITASVALGPAAR